MSGGSSLEDQLITRCRIPSSAQHKYRWADNAAALTTDLVDCPLIDEIVTVSNAIPSIHIFVAIKVDDSGKSVHKAALERRRAIVGNLYVTIIYINRSRVGQWAKEHQVSPHPENATAPDSAARGAIYRQRTVDRDRRSRLNQQHLRTGAGPNVNCVDRKAARTHRHRVTTGG